MASNPRTRSRGGFSQVVAEQTIVCYQAAPTTTYTYASVGTKEEMSDFVTKPFVKGLTWVNTPMSRTQITLSATPGTTAGTCSWPPQPGDQTSWSGSYYMADQSGQFHTDMLNSPLFDYHTLNQEAATKALAGVVRPEVSGMVALKELNSTIAGLTHPLTGLLNFLNGALKTRSRKSARGKRRAAAAAAKGAADQHLSVIFGAMPFINDCQAILKALGDGPKIDFEPQTSRGSSEDFATTSRTITLSTTDESVSLTHRRDVIARAYIIYVHEFETFAHRMGISLEEIPRATWQALPYSFVVDWALGVSSFLGAISPKSGVKVMAQGLVDRIIDTHLAASQGVDTASGPWSWYYRGANQARVVVTTNRVPANLSDFAFLTVKHKRESLLDLFKVTALLSLVTQRAAQLAS